MPAPSLQIEPLAFPLWIVPAPDAFRALFQQQSLADGWTSETIGGLGDRQGHRFMAFDVDATGQASRQRALPCDPQLPAARRRLEAVCAPSYRARKRGEVIRTRTTALQMHTRQWVGTYAGRGNGDSREELARALQAITNLVEALCSPARSGSGASGRALWRRSANC